MTRYTAHLGLRYGAMLIVLAALIAAPLVLSSDTALVELQTASAQTTDTGTTPAPAAPAAKPAVNTYDTECSMNPLYFSFAGCFNVALSWLGSWFLAFGGALLRLAGTLFDTLVTRVVVDFKNTLDTLRVTSAIGEGWTIFRDFSNILIIGIFTFIAVSIILGLKEFGQKKLIANVLIIAVLINFSLLFTKMIIDASNFTAFAIYKQMAAQPENFDIAQAFLTPMKITRVWNDSGTVTQSILKSSGSGFQAFAFGFFGGLILLATAAVIFYGCFLIAARAILLIFLMLTSALAFATYLLPNLAKSNYGWSEWWKTLINAAVFAPLLMLLLSISLAIVSAASAVASTPLGTIIADPRQQLSGDSWTTILLYIIGVGTLFLSFRLASSFAGKISGFNVAAFVPALAFGAGARFAGIMGRQLLGRPALNISERLGDRAVSAANRKNWFAARSYDIASQAFKGAAKRDFNLARTGLGTTIQQNAGIKKLDTLAGAAVKGFAGSQDTFKKNLAESARRMATSKTDQEAEIKKAKEAQLREDTALRESHGAASALKEESAAAHKSENERLKDMQAEQARQMKTLQDTLASAVEAGQRGASNQHEVASAEASIAAKKQEHNLEIRRQSDRIKTAKTLSDQAERDLTRIDESVKRAAIQSGKLPEKFQEAGEIAENLTKGSFTAALFKSSGLGKTRLEKLAKKVGKEAGKQQKQQRIKDEFGPALKDVVRDDDHGHAPAAPATPPTTDGGGGGHGDHGGGGMGTS